VALTSVPLPLSEDWFRTLTETTATAIFVYDQDRFLYVNPACEELTGYTEAELLARGPDDIVHPEHVEMSRARRGARLRGEGTPDRYELMLLRKSGEARWVHLTAGLIQWGGRPAGLGTAVDITERKRAELALRQSQDWLELAQRAGRSIVWEWDVATDEMRMSSVAVALFGTSPEEVPRTGTELRRFIHEEDHEAVSQALRRTLATGEPYIVEHRALTPSGQIRWLAVRGQLLGGQDRWRQRIVGVSVDITEHKLAEEALFQEQERAQVTLASIGDGVIRTDAEGRIDYLNPVAESLTGYTLGEAAGRLLQEIYRVVDEASRKPRPDPVERCLQLQRIVVLSGNSVLIRRDGGEASVRDSAAPIRSRQGEIQGAVLVFQDVTQLRGLEREMSYLARHDSLTGLINRREFERQLRSALGSAFEGERQHAFCYLDLDEFKLVNDTCGHVAGDELLRQLTALLSSQVRESDVLARLGGDEFGVLLVDCTLENARVVAEKLCSTVRQFRFHWEDRVFDVGVSIGVVPLTPETGSLSNAFSAADAACYVAKELGRNRVHIYEPDDRAVAQRYGEMQWVQRINRAFEDGRFRLYRQVIRPLASEGPEMAEILLRMVDEDGKLLSTPSFITAAERYHLIGSIDRWVMETALSLIAQIPDRRVYTINLSGHSLGDPTFFDFVLAQLRDSGVPPQRLCFEITETATIASLARARGFITSLRQLGCRFVLDDFGTGLSSFAYLQTLPVDFLKIDGEFVRQMAGDPVQRALVASIHEIGHLMGLATIAESVESADALDTLQEIGVDYAQGFLIGRPEPM
jgi:diguanylate cyclase (GGDEF)-like protein/PAS domain S-box-containing protein